MIGTRVLPAIALARLPQSIQHRTDVPQRRFPAHFRAGVKGAESAGSPYRHDDAGRRAAATSRKVLSKLRYAIYCLTGAMSTTHVALSPVSHLDLLRKCAALPSTGRSAEADPDHATMFSGGDSPTGSPVNASIGTLWLVYEPVTRINACFSRSAGTRYRQ